MRVIRVATACVRKHGRYESGGGAVNPVEHDAAAAVIYSGKTWSEQCDA